MASPTTAAAGDTRCERPYPPFAPRRLAARRTYWPATSAGSGGDPLFDDLVRSQQERRRDGEAEGLGGLQVDDESKLGWLLYRQISGLRALENLVHVNGREAEHVREVGPI